MAGRCTEAEKSLRVAEVADLVARGWSRGDICRYMATAYGLSESQADRYSYEAREAMADALAEDMGGYAAEVRARYLHLYREALEDGNVALALRCLDSEVRALGSLDAPDPVGEKVRLECLLTPGGVLFSDHEGPVAKDPAAQAMMDGALERLRSNLAERPD